MTTSHPSSTITVYTTGPTCQGCKNTKRWLDRNNIPYTEIDITQDLEAADTAKAYGHTEAPVVVVSDGDTDNDIHWSGFNPFSLANYTKQAA